MAAGSSVDRLIASVITPTWNRAKFINSFLPSLACQNLTESYEIIVADNGSTDATASIVRDLARRWPHVRMISESRPGAGRARHAGAVAARSPLLIFIDDDMLAEPGLVAEHMRAHAEAPGGVVLGKMISASGRHPFERMMAYIYDGPMSDLERRPAGPFDYWSGNVSISRDLYFRLGGYSEALAELRTGEDLLFGARLSSAGVAVRFAPGAIVHHHFVERFGARLNRAYRDGVAMAYAKERHPELPLDGAAPGRGRRRSLLIEWLCRVSARIMEPMDSRGGVPAVPLSFVYDLGLRNAIRRGMTDYKTGRAAYRLKPIMRAGKNSEA
jgi:glycosyltransferase involved in cell wall biosynthesis